MKAARRIPEPAAPNPDPHQDFVVAGPDYFGGGRIKKAIVNDPSGPSKRATYVLLSCPENGIASPAIPSIQEVLFNTPE